MKPNLSRRQFMASAIAIPVLKLLDVTTLSTPSMADELLRLGPASPFAFAWLREQAKQLATQPYRAPPIRHAGVLNRIDYEVHQQISYRPEAALWMHGDGPYPVQFFHLARFYKEPVKIYVVHDGRAREILYSRMLFEYKGGARFAKALPDDMGFAGFRVMYPHAHQDDWLAFLGASYFRSSGELGQYGLSARGITINTALPPGEEFPRFTRFWLETAADPGAVMIYALLDGPSITGAYRIEAARQERVVMDIEAVLFTRNDIRRLGVAPMSSMFWFSETNHWQAQDWRPEVHDSDGLVLWTSNGEQIWRPLNNPPSVQVSSFFNDNLKGFGLFQRDRNFENYQDDSVFYERRPSLWAEPLEPWEEGTVQLVEIPTDEESDDNIVAYWVPKTPIQAGSTWNFKYRLQWLSGEPYSPTLGRVIATRLKPDIIQERPYTVIKLWLVIDFAGGPLEAIERNAPIKPVISAARGKLVSSSVLPVVGTRWWRVTLDIEVRGRKPLDIRAHLQSGNQILTETWLYQFVPHFR
jgi:glucans biosynthesis protein